MEWTSMKGVSGSEASGRTIRVIVALVLPWTLLACGGDDTAKGEDVGDSNAEVHESMDTYSEGDRGSSMSFNPPDPEPVELTSRTGCKMDLDCDVDLFCFHGRCSYQCQSDGDCSGNQSCSLRGRCLQSSKSDEADPSNNPPANSTIEPGLTIIRLPERVQRVKAGQLKLEVSVGLNDKVPSSGLLYSTRVLESASLVEDSAPVEDNNEVLTALADPMGVDSDLLITILAGNANPSNEMPSVLQVQVITAAGSFFLTLTPEIPMEGHYAGRARTPLFGSQGLPIDFLVIVDPPGASLSDATTVEIALPVRQSSLFSPVPPTSLPDQYAFAEAKYDDDLELWSADFEREFVFPEESILSIDGSAAEKAAQRKLHFEIESVSGVHMFIGTVRDTWIGLYDQVSAGGAKTVAKYSLIGDLEVFRVAGLPAISVLEEARSNDVEPTLPPPSFQSAPPATACLDEHLSQAEWEDSEGAMFNCSSFVTVEEFAAPTADLQHLVNCAIAVGQTALEGDTTGKQIEAYLNEGEDSPSNLSFAQFMENCASGKDGTCVSSPEVLCARQLTAYAHSSIIDVLPENLDLLIVNYEELTQEAFLGKQMGAFQTDSTSRLGWLKKSDYPPLLANLGSHNEDLLNKWAEGVLEVHLAVLGGQVDASGLAILARGTDSEDAQERRRGLLTTACQSWRAASDALLLATNRWHELYKDAPSREAKTNYVTPRMFDLYVIAGILKQVNLQADAGYNNATFGGGFGALLDSLGELSLPFSKLIYARDAEVVVSTSLDPSADNNTVLSNLKAEALNEIEVAGETVQGILAEAQAKALSEEELRNRLDNEIELARDQLIELCGLPDGCDNNDFGVEAGCDVLVAAGQCGFIIKKGAGEAGGIKEEDYLTFESSNAVTSRAGLKLLSVLEAGKNLSIAEQESAMNAALSKGKGVEQAACLASVDAMVEQEKSSLEAIKKEIADTKAVLEAELDTTQIAELKAFNSAIDGATNSLNDFYDDSAEDIAEWETTRVNGVELKIGLLTSATALEIGAAAMLNTVDFLDETTEATLEGLPKCVGVTNDPSATARLAFKTTAAAAKKPLKWGAFAAESAAKTLQVSAELKAAMSDAELTYKETLADQQAIQHQELISTMLTEAETVATIKSEAARQYSNQMIEKLTAEFEFAATIHEMKAHCATLTYQALELTQDKAVLAEREAKAELGIDQRWMEYFIEVQKAELQQARLADIVTQRAAVNELLGSPAAVFSWANRLRQAEFRLGIAKDKLMEWLVAMEYFAVRPFMDQRIQVLLARNAYQLEEIAKGMSALQDGCGGVQSKHTAVVSARKDLFGLTTGRIDAVTGEEFSAEETFRELLSSAFMPIDRRTRYTTESTIGDMLERDDLMAGTFQLRLDEFANLAATCNAKIVSFEIKLVGADLGSGQPTVSILYDGTSQLRSCQFGIQEYVEEIGEAATAFGEITSLRTPGRSISPVAGINEFNPDGSENVSLAGLPLACQYTVLIDPKMGENSKIAWDRVDDIELKITYTYQDLFPEGKCN